MKCSGDKYCFLGSKYYDFSRSYINEINTTTQYSDPVEAHDDDKPIDRMYYIVLLVLLFALFYYLFMRIVV